MRKAASLGSWFAATCWLALLGCLPQEKLSAYSGGLSASGASATEPASSAGASSADPASSSASESEGASAPSGTPANTDGPAQPDVFAGGGGSPATAGGDAPAAGTGSTAEPAPAAPDAPDASSPEVAPEPEPPSSEPTPLGPVRFVRLVADSEFNGGPLSAAAELDVFGADGEVLDRTGWVASADSAEPTFVGGAPPALAIDGLAGSVWHTAWFQLAAPPPHPHYLQLDMVQPRTVTGFRYLARQDASVGRVADYRFFVSVDGVEWGEPVLAGRLQDSPLPQEVRIAAPGGAVNAP